MTTTLAAVETDALEHLCLAGVAVDDRIAGLARRAHPRGIVVERDVFETQLLQHARKVLTDATESAQDDVLALRHGVCARQFACQCRRRRTALPQQPARNLLVVADDERAYDHAQHDRGQQRLHDVRRDQLVAQQDGEQCEAEFTANTDDDPGAQRT